MEVVLLHNQNAGNSEWTRKALIKLVRRAGFEPEYLPIKAAVEKPERLRRGKFAIVAGGDGAIRKAVHAAADLQVPLAPLPLGTANNISHSLGVSGRPEDIVAGWERKLRHVPFDLGIARGPWGRRCFVEGVGLGLISRTIAVLTDIDEVSVHEWKKAKHKLHRDACVAAALAHELHALPVSLAIDGRDRSADYLLLEILNIRRAGPAVELAPDALPADGQFDLVMVTDQQRGRLLKSLKARLADSNRVRGLTTRHARKVRLKVRRDCELRIDDGCVPLAAGQAVEFTIDRKAIEFIVPG